ncbi:Guanine nucleotide-releasing factor 2 [Eumeta japonica]|uniref:CRK SH3-binding GNRP n=1 Tax=Eumeta variegata TaxID=151549 RepID=A0A4C1TDA0_EUMVA|nr:Guanine nucleotide-releasing factor 2 [Eumeta japonica]
MRVYHCNSSSYAVVDPLIQLNSTSESLPPPSPRPSSHNSATDDSLINNTHSDDVFINSAGPGKFPLEDELEMLVQPRPSPVPSQRSDNGLESTAETAESNTESALADSAAADDIILKTDVSAWLLLKGPNKDGPDVRGGHPEALIVLATKATKDFAYQEAFLATYRTWVSPSGLVARLVRRARHFRTRHHELRSTLSLLTRVVADLTTVDLDGPLMQEIMDFVYWLVETEELHIAKALRQILVDKQRQLHQMSPAHTRRVAHNTGALSALLARRAARADTYIAAPAHRTGVESDTSRAQSISFVLTHAQGWTFLPSSNARASNRAWEGYGYAAMGGTVCLRRDTLLDFKSSELAEQMTLLDAALFTRITTAEVLSWPRDQSEESSPNLTRFTEHFNKMSYWARSRILEQDEARERERYATKFLKVMKVLRKMNNFNSYLALISALDSPPVSRLGWTRAIYDALLDHCKIIDSSSSFRAYRQALADTQPPCIPYIGLVLQDLTFVHAGNPDLLPDGSINFTKRLQQYQIMENMKSRQYKFPKNERIIAMFNGFDDVLSEEAMWQISETIKPRGGKAKATPAPAAAAAPAPSPAPQTAV